MADEYNPYKMFVGAFVPNWLMERQEVGAGAKLCWARLAQHAGEDGICKPRQTVLAVELGVRERMVRNYVTELESHQLIRVERPGLRQANRYHFLKHPWMAAPVAGQERQDVAGQERTDSAGQERQDVAGPSKGREPAVRESEEESSTAAPTAQTYLGAVVDYIRAKTGNPSYQPDKRVAAMLAVELKGSLDAGASDEHIRAGCRHWADRDLHPRTLGSVIDQFRRGGRRRLMSKTGLEIWDDETWREAIKQMGEQDGQDGMGHPGQTAPGVLPRSGPAAGNGGSVVARR